MCKNAKEQLLNTALGQLSAALQKQLLGTMLKQLPGTVQTPYGDVHLRAFAKCDKNFKSHREHIAELLSEAAGQSVGMLKVVEGERPVFADSPFDSNWTHCENLCVMAFSKNAIVGVDAERLRPRSLRVAKRFFNIKEWEFLQAESIEKQLAEGIEVQHARNIEFQNSANIGIQHADHVVKQHSSTVGIRNSENVVNPHSLETNINPTDNKVLSPTFFKLWCRKEAYFKCVGGSFFNDSLSVNMLDGLPNNVLLYEWILEFEGEPYQVTLAVSSQKN